MRIDVYTRFDAYVGTIGEADLLSCVHADELNGEDSLALETTFPIYEGYRLVWRDSTGTAHEHVCQEPTATHSEAGVVYSDTALNSVCELYGDYIEDRRPYSYTFARALGVCLETTRWEAGTVDQTGTVSSGLTFYHTDCRTALNDILECGGELETEIEVGTGGVTARAVGIRAHRGSTSTHRRFAYEKDVASIRRIQCTDAITACYGYGKGEETDSGGYGRKISFGDINGGLDYVEDSEALELYGRPDGEGGKAHVFGIYENSECEDASELLEETRAYLDENKEPSVSYEADVVDLVQFGRQWEGVGVGDEVQIVDRCFDPELRATGRVTKLEADLLSGQMTVTLGNVVETLADVMAAQQAEIASISRRSSNWDVAAFTPGAYLQQIIDGLNEQFNTAGMSYCFTSFEKGTIWSSVPLDEEGNPTQTGGSAIQICSQGFRIASGTLADGSYDWRTFGTGDGFTADEITAGTIQGGSSHWNLDTGDLLLSQGSIASADGRSVWDLTNSTFTTRDMTAISMTATSIDASGTFSCGSADTGGIVLSSSGQMVGYREGDRAGYVDYSAAAYDVDDPSELFYGLQMQAEGIVRISSPLLSTAATSDVSATTTNGLTGTRTVDYVERIEDNGDGTITWWTREGATLSFINGICTGCTLGLGQLGS